MARALPTTNPPAELLQQLQKALAHQKSGEMAEADKTYQKALREYPEFADVSVMAAVFYIQIEKYKYAITILGRALKQKPADFTANKLMGKALYLEGNYKKAAEHLAQAINLQSTDQETASFLGLTLSHLGQHDVAETYLRQAAHTTKDPKIINKLAETLIRKQRMAEAKTILEQAIKKDIYDYDTYIRLAIAIGEGRSEATPVLLRAINMWPENDQAKTLLSMNSRLVGIPPRTGLTQEEQRNAIELAVNCAYADPRDLRLVWFSGFFRAPQEIEANKEVFEILNLKSYEDFLERFSQSETRKLFYSSFFISGLRRVIVSATRLERLFRFIRKYYLNVVANSIHPLSEGDWNIIESMSHQCFLTEYVFDVDDYEVNQLEFLKDKILKSPEDNADALAIYACYESLHTLPNMSAISALTQSLPNALHSIINIQIEDYLKQQNFKKNISSLTQITDATSLLVRQQYEENPYPRWQSMNILIKEYQPATAEKAKDHKILIAGCGTGKHVMQTAVTSPKSEILAFDLSFSSLAYAKMKIEEYGVKNIRFMQGDILDLAMLKERFDVVDSSGVIHHMKNPEDGLKALLSVLKPGGRLKLGLYSAIARQDVQEARQYIAQNNIEPTLPNIRKMRKYMAEEKAEQYPHLLDSYDFYSTSSCRDLIFHFQEKCYTLLEIKDMLQRHNLEFETFVLPEIQIEGFRKQMGDLKNLDLWHEYELKHPRLFAGMYQFTTRKL